MTSPTATILIVDDGIQNRELLEVMLENEGYLTCAAAYGEEALASIAQHAPDPILLDIMMPDMDGYAPRRRDFPGVTRNHLSQPLHSSPWGSEERTGAAFEAHTSHAPFAPSHAEDGQSRPNH